MLFPQTVQSFAPVNRTFRPEPYYHPPSLMVFRSWVEQHFGNLDIDLERWGKKIEVQGRVGAYGNYTKRMTLLFMNKAFKYTSQWL